MLPLELEVWMIKSLHLLPWRVPPTALGEPFAWLQENGEETGTDTRHKRSTVPLVPETPSERGAGLTVLYI